MICRLLEAKPLQKLVLTHCWLNFWEQILMTFQSKYSLERLYIETGPVQNMLPIQVPAVGVAKPISPVLLFSQFFRVAKRHISYWISRLYVAGVATAQLRWHLLNMDVIKNI